MQLYWGDWGVLHQSMHHGLPWHRYAWLCGTASPGHSAGYGRCGQEPLRAAAGLGPRDGLFVPPQRCGGQSPAVSVPVGTVTKCCICSPRLGHRQGWYHWSGQFHPTSITPQPTGGAPSLALAPWPHVPQMHSPQHMQPQIQQGQGLQIPLASSTGCTGAALCLLLLGRGREPCRQ